MVAHVIKEFIKNIGFETTSSRDSKLIPAKEFVKKHQHRLQNHVFVVSKWCINRLKNDVQSKNLSRSTNIGFESMAS